MQPIVINNIGEMQPVVVWACSVMQPFVVGTIGEMQPVVCTCCVINLFVVKIFGEVLSVVL